MKKIWLVLLTGIILSGCYTTFYPSEAMNMGGAEAVPDSTRQIIINNYYETTEYYQVPHYRRYSLLWGDYYWDPFYYDYSYYSWRPYYWYGNYYYYNPHNHYWYYYDRYHHWDNGYWTGSGGSSGGNADKERIHKPGYNVLMNSPTGAAPFVSVGSDNDHISKPVKKVGVNVNSGITNDNNYSPQIQSVGKKSLNGNTSSRTVSKKMPSTYKPSSTTGNSKKPSSTYSTQKQSSSNRSTSSSSKSKSSSTNSTSSKNSRSESSSSSSKKSK